MLCWRTSGSSLKSCLQWELHHLRVPMCWVLSPRSFRTECALAGKPTGWLDRLLLSPRSIMKWSPARKWRHPGRRLPELQSLIPWGLLPPRLGKLWLRSRPFELAQAEEPAIDPTPTCARSLARLLRLPQPDNVDGSQVGARLADFAPHWRSLKVQSVHQHWMTDPNITARDLHRLLGMLVGVHGFAGTTGKTSSSSGPVVDRHMVPEDRELVRPDPSSSVGSVRGGLLGISSSPARSTPRRQGDGSDSLHGCVQFGLGSPVRLTLDTGTAVSISMIVAHQRSGDAGCHQRCGRLPASSEVPGGSLDVRQRSDCGLHQERGGHKIAHFDAADCWSGVTARRLRWFPSICQECTTSRRIPCPESARHWPGSGRWPLSVYDLCLPSGASHGSTCLRHSPTDDSSSSYRRIRTPGQSGQMPCPCLGTTGGASCTRSRHSRWSLKYCRRLLSHQEWRWFWSLNCNWQRHGFRSWWICFKKIRSRCTSKVKTCWLKMFGQATGWPRLVTSGCQIYTCGNSTGHPKDEGPFQGSCKHDVKVPSGIFTPSVWIPLVTCFESEVIISAPTWCTSSETDFSHRR